MKFGFFGITYCKLKSKDLKHSLYINCSNTYGDVIKILLGFECYWAI